MFEFKEIPDDLSTLDPEALYFLVDQYGTTYIGRIEGKEFGWVSNNPENLDSLEDPEILEDLDDVENGYWAPTRYGFSTTRLTCGLFEAFPMDSYPVKYCALPEEFKLRY